MFGKAKWIWMNNSPKPDEYADFFVDFDFDVIVTMLNDFKKFFDSHISHLGANRSRSYIYFFAPIIACV